MTIDIGFINIQTTRDSLWLWIDTTSQKDLSDLTRYHLEMSLKDYIDMQNTMTDEERSALHRAIRREQLEKGAECYEAIEFFVRNNRQRWIEVVYDDERLVEPYTIRKAS